MFLVEVGFHHVPQVGLELLRSGNPPTLVSQSARIRGVSHRTWPQLIFYIFNRERVYYVGQAGLKLLNSGDLPASATQSAGITGVSHHTRPVFLFVCFWD